MDPVISGRDIDLSSCHCDITCGMDSVSGSSDIKCSGFYIKVPVFNFVRCQKPIVTRCYRDRSIFDPNAVVYVDRIIHCRYSNCTAGDHQIIVGGYSMAVLCVHIETAAAIDRKIVVSKDRAVRSVAERSVGIG